MIFKIINRNLRKFKRWQRYHNTVVELSRLTNRELADLGINRCDIERVAKQSIHREGVRKAEMA